MYRLPFMKRRPEAGRLYRRGQTPQSGQVGNGGVVLYGGKSSMDNQDIVAQLESIYRQIKNYPTPIAGCDEQFNFLLSERNRLQNLLTTAQKQSVTVE